MQKAAGQELRDALSDDVAAQAGGSGDLGPGLRLSVADQVEHLDGRVDLTRRQR